MTLPVYAPFFKGFEEFGCKMSNSTPLMLLQFCILGQKCLKDNMLGSSRVSCASPFHPGFLSLWPKQSRKVFKAASIML